MNIWVKFSSIAIIGFFIYGVIDALSVAIKLLSFSYSGLAQILLFTILQNILAILIFTPPIFYYAWIKRPESQPMKLWTRGVTIVFIGFVIWGFVSSKGLDFPRDIVTILPTFVVIIPQYYYAWGRWDILEEVKGELLNKK